jgi:hypothetical protein
VTDNPRDLAKVLLVLAEALERQGAGVNGLGIIRRSASFLASLPEPSHEPTCPACGGAVGRPARGRPRVYCSVPCRRRVEKARRNEEMVS